MRMLSILQAIGQKKIFGLSTSVETDLNPEADFRGQQGEDKVQIYSAGRQKKNRQTQTERCQSVWGAEVQKDKQAVKDL